MRRRRTKVLSVLMSTVYPLSMSKPGIVVDGEAGSGVAEDEAKAEAIRNQSESATAAGSWRLVERMLEARWRQLDDREQAVAARERNLDEREAQAASAMRQAAIEAREAGTKLLEEASTRAAVVVRAALDEAILVGQKAMVDAGAVRQAAQDHLVAGIALADAARLPPKPAPTGGETFLKVGEMLVGKAASVFESLMLANPEASAKLAKGIAGAVSRDDSDEPSQPAAAADQRKGATFSDVAAAAEQIGKVAVMKFLRERGCADVADLTLADGEALVALAASLKTGAPAAE